MKVIIAGKGDPTFHLFRITININFFFNIKQLIKLFLNTKTINNLNIYKILNSKNYSRIKDMTTFQSVFFLILNNPYIFSSLIILFANSFQ